MKKEKSKETPTLTRAEKTDGVKKIVRELLSEKPYKHNELIEEVAKVYASKFGGEDTPNDVKGRVGSVLDIMKKESDVAYDNGMYMLKARGVVEPSKAVEKKEEKPKKTTRSKVKKAETVEEKQEEIATEKPVKKRAKKSTKVKAEEKKEEVLTEKSEEKKPLPVPPLQPIAPVDPTTPETAPEPAPKKRGRKAKAVVEEIKIEEKEAQPQEKAVEKPKKKAPSKSKKAEEKTEVKTEEIPVVKAAEIPEIKPVEKAEEKPVIANPPVVKEKGELAQKSVVVDMSFLFGEPKAKARAEQKPVEVKTEEKPEIKTEEKPVQNAEIKPVAEVKSAEIKPKTENKPVAESKPVVERKPAVKGVKILKKTTQKPLTADEKLCESFLKRMRALGGDYFEYYSVYLLERYSMKNGRRLEGMRICGGDHDGGIDGEIELTDKFGFKETIYIQAKNWDPEKGDEKLWTVGETLVQQFIGACACKQAREGKQHCRGIFITTSRFTPDAKRILEDMSDKIIGYDGKELFETAKECEFGIIRKNGEWALDEKLLSGTKVFFNLY